MNLQFLERARRTRAPSGTMSRRSGLQGRSPRPIEALIHGSARVGLEPLCRSRPSTPLRGQVSPTPAAQAKKASHPHNADSRTPRSIAFTRARQETRIRARSAGEAGSRLRHELREVGDPVPIALAAWHRGEARVPKAQTGEGPIGKGEAPTRAELAAARRSLGPREQPEPRSTRERRLRPAIRVPARRIRRSSIGGGKKTPSESQHRLDLGVHSASRTPQFDTLLQTPLTLFGHTCQAHGPRTWAA